MTSNPEGQELGPGQAVLMLLYGWWALQRSSGQGGEADVAPVLSDLEYTLATQKVRLRKAAERQLLEAREWLGSLRGRVVDPRRRLVPSSAGRRCLVACTPLGRWRARGCARCAG